MNIEYERLSPNNIEDILPLTQLQKSMIYSFLIDETSNKYFEQWRYKIKGLIKFESFVKAWNYVVENNELLRCVFRWHGLHEPLMIILKKRELEIQKIDLKSKKNDDLQPAADKIALKEWEQKVDLQENPIRIVFVALLNDEYEMIITSHHIILDGWSNAIILNELFKYYLLICKKEPIYLCNKSKYKEYLKYQKKINTQESIDYWRKYLAGYRYRPLINIDDSIKKHSHTNIDKIHLNESSVNSLNEYCRENNITLAALICSALAMLCSKYQNSFDVMFGVTVSGRNINLNGVHETVGVFIKTLPLRMSFEETSKIISILQEANKLLVELETHKNIENSDLMSISPDSFKATLNVVLVIQNYPVSELLLSKDSSVSIQLQSSFYEIDSDIVIGVKAFGSTIDVEISYKQTICDFIKDFLQDYPQILKQITEKPNSTIKEVSVSQKQKVEMNLRKLDFTF